MNNVAHSRTTTRLETAVSTAYLLPGMLILNTAALFALDQVGAIPSWLKSVAALFLAF